MKTNLKRLLALILALSMVMSLLSTSAWAADTSADGSGDPAVSSTEPQEAEPEEAAPEGNAEEAAPEGEPEEAAPEGEAAQPEEAETKPKEEQPKPKMKAKKQQAMSLTAFADGNYRMLGEATSHDIGKVVCNAGHLHDAKTTVPDGCTAVGIVGTVNDSTGNGLILALADSSNQKWSTINGWQDETTHGTTLKLLPDDTARGSLTSYTTLGSTTVSNWAVAQKDDYVAIFTNLGSTKNPNGNGNTFDDNVNAYITGAGGTMLTQAKYWTATVYNDYNAWEYASWNVNFDFRDFSYMVRPVIGFTAAPHTHNTTYIANDNTITAMCSGAEIGTLTIAAPTLTTYGQTGEGISAEATITDANGIKGSATVKYYNANEGGTAKEGEALTAAPTAWGKYWAEITLTNGGSNANDSATAHVVYTITNPDYTITTPTNLEHGTVTANKDKATFNEVVTLTITPESDDYICKTLTVTDASSNPVTVKNNQFTMPASEVTVSAAFAAKKSTGVSLTVNQVNEKGGTASLLKSSFAALGNDTIQSGDKFILCVTPEDEYDYTVTFSTNADYEELSEQDYKDYLTYAKTNNIYVSPNAVMYWVTMPYIESGNLTATVEFAKTHAYTILYQPQSGTTPNMVFCKIGTEQQNTEVVKFGRMSSGAKMGSDTVWTMTITTAFDPKKVAFVGSNAVTTDDEKIALANSIKDAAMSTATVTQTTDSTWNSITGGKYLIYGGNAKVVTAVFVSDPKAVTTIKDNTVDAASSNDVSYQFAVCPTGGNGTVTAPAAPDAPEGKAFGGWRGITRTDPYQPNDPISITENTTFTAVWNPVKPTITLDLNKGSMSGETPTSVDYNTKLNLSEPTRSGYVFDRWTVSEAVTESGTYYAKGSTFDLNKPITANLKLTAQWKHVHSYKCYQISSFGDKLAKYEKYGTAIHVAACGCGDVQLVAHEFDATGKCKCGYQKPGAATTVTLTTSYVKMSGESVTATINGGSEEAEKNEEVEICAPGKWGESEFSKWEYKIGSGEWTFLTADAYASFLIPATMSVRAVYTNKVTYPTVTLSSRHYDDHAEVGGKTYTMGNILYQMNYKLPDGCTFVDGGIKLGDNSGISYYFIQQVRMSYDNESKGIIAGITAGVAGLGVLANTFAGGGGDPVGLISSVASADFEGYSVNYLETEENVLEKKLTSATLAEYMYEGKPVNVEKYPPIYWEARVPTKGMSGSIATAPPLSFAQKNNRNHYIYGIAWMRYKDKKGKIQTIYTNAINPTVNNPNARAINPAQ